MTSTIDAITRIISNNYYNHLSHRETAAAILETLKDRIPDLVWDQIGSVTYRADLPSGGQYLVETGHEEGFGMWTPHDDQEDEPVFGYHDTPEAAKAAANAHNKAQAIKLVGWNA